MKMKKLVTLMLTVAILAAVALTGCSGSVKDSGSTETTVAADTKEADAETEAPERDADGAPMKVGVLYISTKTDGGWSQGHAEGFAEAVETIGADKVQLIEKESVADTDAQATETAIRAMIQEGCEIIFATSFGFMETVERMSHEFPEVKFEHCSGYMSNENMDNYFGQIEQARYLSGIAAGYKTETDKIGFVAAQPIPEVIRGVNAFTLGVRSVNPEAEVHVKFSMTWFDPGKETETAKALLDEGCDVLAMHQDTPSTLKAAEDAGGFAVGYDLSAADVVPNAYLTAPLWNWSVYYTHKLNAMLDGTWAVEQSWGGMKEDLIQLDELTDLVPEEAVAKIDEVMADIVEQGNAYVFAGPLKDQAGNEVCPEGQSISQEDQMAMDYFVEGVVGSIPTQ